MSKNYKRKLELDVYDENDNEDPSKKLERRRGGGGGQLNRTLDHVDVVELDTKIEREDDEEITEDEAFDEEDEEKYGMFFPSKTNESEEEEIQSDFMDLSEMLNEKEDEEVKPKKSKIDFLIPQSETETDSEGDLELSLSEAQESDQEKDLTSILKVNPEALKRKRMDERTEVVDESEFILKHNQVKKKIVLQDLLSGVAEETGFSELKKQMDVMGKNNIQPVSAPLATRIQDRVNRIAAKEETDKSISKWTQLVKINREADVLQFPMNEANVQTNTSRAIADSFKPFNDMESEINQILDQSGLTEKKIQEWEELELNKLSQEEMMKRRAELAKMRSLMFYKEQKQKKIAKIKSKTYHKIAKKAAEKNQLSLEELEKLDPEQAKEERDRMEFERAKERMTLKHKNTGKWAKKLLGRSQDAETQKALMEQLEQGDKLRRRIQGADSEESESEIEDGDDARLNGLSKLQNMAHELANDNMPKKGIFAMKFMQRGIEKQKQDTFDAITAAKNDLENHNDSSSDEDKDCDNDNFTSTNGRHKFCSPKNAVKLDEVVPSKSAPKNKGVTVKSSGPLQVKSEPLFKVESFGDDVAAEDKSTTNKQVSNPVKKVKANAPVNIEKEKESTVDESSNPWLQEDDDNLVKKSIRPAHKPFERISKDEKAMLKIASEKEKLLDAQNDDSETLKSKITAETDSEEDFEVEPHLVHISNSNQLKSKDIMRMAFANDNIEADFQKEKEREADIESGKTIETELPGWGDWSGPGINKKPKSKVVMKADGVDISKRKDKNLKHVIINEKRSKKAAKYMLPKLPPGFENRSQYERTLATPLGKEWNTHSSHKKLIQPRVNVKAGAVIHPLRFTGKDKTKTL